MKHRSIMSPNAVEEKMTCASHENQVTSFTQILFITAPTR